MTKNTALTLKTNKIQSLIKDVKTSYGKVYVNNKISGCLYNYCLALQELNCTSYLGTILLNKSTSWVNLNKFLNWLPEYLLKAFNIANLFIVTELHRSRPNQKHSLHGYPHIHFIATYSSQEVLGPDLSKVLLGLQDEFLDVTIKKIGNTTKSLLQAHKYLFKDLDKKDINAFFDYLNIRHSTLKLYSTNLELMAYLKRLDFIIPDKNKYDVVYKQNSLCRFFSSAASDTEYAFYILENLLRQSNSLYKEGFL